MVLTQILHKNCVKVPLDSKDKESTITELIDLLDTEGLLSDRNTALDSVLVREKTRSTGIGAGIAIPHGKCKAAKELVMAVGISKDGIDFASIDNQPVKIVILLVSPIDQTGPHIQALAKISRLMLNQEFKSKLENAQTNEEVVELLNSQAK